MNVLTVDYRHQDAPILFSKSLQQTGFAVLYNHPIDTKIILTAYEAWQDFFSTANNEKEKYRYQKKSQDGYFPFRIEKAKDAEVSDLKEFFHFYPWGRVPEHLKEISMTVRESLTKLANELLQWVELSLPAQVAAELSMPLQEMITDSKETLLRILHYPPLKKVEGNAVRAAAHEDINLITLLPAATAPGLEVLSSGKKWYAVSCDPGNIVVNVGDMLQMCTRNYYQSTTHRVVNPNQHDNISRYSMPLFLHPRPEVELSANFTAREYLIERLRQIGVY